MTQEYYGTKRVAAWPEERGGVPGYAVQYEGGYLSWSPREPFEKDYQSIDAMSFGHAIKALKAGHKVQRAGWNGKGMFLFYTDEVPGFGPFIAINTGSEVRPWLASQADMLSDDWKVVDDEG